MANQTIIINDQEYNKDLYISVRHNEFTTNKIEDGFTSQDANDILCYVKSKVIVVDRIFISGNDGSVSEAYVHADVFVTTAFRINKNDLLNRSGAMDEVVELDGNDIENKAIVGMEIGDIETTTAIKIDQKDLIPVVEKAMHDKLTAESFSYYIRLFD